MNLRRSHRLGSWNIFRSVFYPKPVNVLARKVGFSGQNRNASERETIEDDASRSCLPCKYKPRELPEVAYFRVQYSEAFARSTSGNPWIVLVSCRDGKGLRLASDVGYEFEMSVQEAFGTREDAIAAGKSFQETWGKK